jgi:hypothetical protein
MACFWAICCKSARSSAVGMRPHSWPRRAIPPHNATASGKRPHSDLLGLARQGVPRGAGRLSQFVRGFVSVSNSTRWCVPPSDVKKPTSPQRNTFHGQHEVRTSRRQHVDGTLDRRPVASPFAPDSTGRRAIHCPVEAARLPAPPQNWARLTKGAARGTKNDFVIAVATSSWKADTAAAGSPALRKPSANSLMSSARAKR